MRTASAELNDPQLLHEQAQLQQRLTRHKWLGRLLMIASGRDPRKVELRMQQRIAAADKASHDRISQLSAAADQQLAASAHRQQSMVEYAGQRNAYSLVKNIPRRPLREGEPGFVGNYQELASNTLSSALASQRQPDGTVRLLGDSVRQQRAQAATESSTVPQIAANEDAYNGGVATALWQLGFIETKNGEEDIALGRAQFSPEIEWSQTTMDDSQSPTTVHRAQLPFDANNELHGLLVPDHLRDNPNLALELEFSQGVTSQYGESLGGDFMNLRVVPQQHQG